MVLLRRIFKPPPPSGIWPLQRCNQPQCLHSGNESAFFLFGDDWFFMRSRDEWAWDEKMGWCNRVAMVATKYIAEWRWWAQPIGFLGGLIRLPRFMHHFPTKHPPLSVFQSSHTFRYYWCGLTQSPESSQNSKIICDANTCIQVNLEPLEASDNLQHILQDAPSEKPTAIQSKGLKFKEPLMRLLHTESLIGPQDPRFQWGQKESGTYNTSAWDFDETQDNNAILKRDLRPQK